MSDIASGQQSGLQGDPLGGLTGGGAGEVVHRFLSLMEARDLAGAKALLAEGFVMTFPGKAVMRELEELVAWSRGRYRFVRKSYERFDVMGEIVYCFGTLSGEWLDGSSFEGIRFIDRFELAGGKLARQDVWNDMGELKSRV